MYLKLIDEDIKEVATNYNNLFYTFLSTSNYCNANCKFCDVKKNKLFKSSIDIYKLIDELSELGTKYIHFTGGGEPFFNDDIYDYMEYCTKKGLKIIFITNGYNLNEEKIKKLTNYNIRAVFFSIDSYKSEIHDEIRGISGLWDIVTNNINLIKKYMPHVKINLNHVLNKTNIDDFANFILLKEKYNFDYINPLIVKDCEDLFFTDKQIENYNKNLDSYYELAHVLGVEFLAENIDFFNSKISELGSRSELDDMKCICPSFTAFIDAPSGGVYPCDCSLHRNKEIYKIGDLHKQTLREIWDGEKRRILSKMLLNSELECKTKCDQANCLFNKKLIRRLNI